VHKFLSKAIQILSPNAEWSLYGNDIENIQWLKVPNGIPSTYDILNTITQLELEEQNILYKEQRRNEYPSIEDQLDLLYHTGYDGWKTIISEIKQKYPKVNNG
jgi:hypothetical protein